MIFCRRVMVVAWPLMVAGCSSVDVGFDSPNPQGRTLALAHAAKTGDDAAIPEMIVLLNSVDSAERMFAIHCLVREAGETMGYRHYAPEAERLVAQRRWADWWSAREAGAEEVSR